MYRFVSAGKHFQLHLTVAAVAAYNHRHCAHLIQLGGDFPQLNFGIPAMREKKKKKIQSKCRYIHENMQREEQCCMSLTREFHVVVVILFPATWRTLCWRAHTLLAWLPNLWSSFIKIVAFSSYTLRRAHSCIIFAFFRSGRASRECSDLENWIPASPDEVICVFCIKLINMPFGQSQQL